MTDNNVKLRKCLCCKEKYPVHMDYFGVYKKRGKRYFTSWCKECYKEYNRQNSVKRRNRDRVKEWKKLNPDKVKTQKVKYFLRVKRKKKV